MNRFLMKVSYSTKIEIFFAIVTTKMKYARNLHLWTKTKFVKFFLFDMV